MHVVSERLGHSSAVVTMTIYAHVPPGSQREAAGTYAPLIGEARTAWHLKCHFSVTAPGWPESQAF